MLKSANTDEHAIIVLGEPLSGRSFFSESVARAIAKNALIKIQPPVNGSTDKDDLIRILQKQLKSTTTNHDILKKAPKDYDPNHPAIEFLKLKSFTATQKISDELFSDIDFAKKITQKLIVLKPLNEFLNRALETVE